MRRGSAPSINYYFLYIYAEVRKHDLAQHISHNFIPHFHDNIKKNTLLKCDASHARIII